MSNRWLQKDFLRCGKCSFIMRNVRGYSPIPNPVLFKSENHCAAWFTEQRMNNGFQNMLVSGKCPSCAKVHSQWTWMSFQEFLRAKEKMSAAERRKYSLILKSSSSDASPSVSEQQ